MALIVSASAATSPLASTVTLRVRSPSATAVVASAIWRTWSVRLAAMTFTESVRSFHVPATPGTSAWPPSRPSVPTSRATPVTCSAKSRSVSVIEFIVSASAATSPLASTVTFCVRSPPATARVTWAIWRTWSVRFEAMTFTESVRSRHVPLTSATSACPPSSPSVPTSRATRVTSSAKAERRSTIALIVRLSWRTSPRASTVICCVRSPSATAVVTCAIWRTCSVRFDAIPLTESVRSFQVPLTPLTCAWPPRRPSVPTSRATRVTSSANDESCSTIVLTVVPMRANSPLTGWPSMVRAMVRLRSPRATASMTRADLRRGAREVVDERVDGLDALRPRAVEAGERRALGHPALASDDPADPRELLRHPGVAVDELVHARLQVAHDVVAAGGQPRGEVPVASRGERLEDLLERLLVAG